MGLSSTFTFLLYHIAEKTQGMWGKKFRMARVLPKSGRRLDSALLPIACADASENARGGSMYGAALLLPNAKQSAEQTVQKAGRLTDDNSNHGIDRTSYRVIFGRAGRMHRLQRSEQWQG